MTTRKTTTELRRCAGSTTFGIEPHQSPITDFPVQPSRKDGLGVMCKPHWTEYTRALRQAAKGPQDGARGRGRQRSRGGQAAGHAQVDQEGRDEEARPDGT